MTFYIDIILMENMIMNYIILFATGIIIKVSLKQTKLIFASLLGSLYAILVYMQNNILISNIVIKVILSIVMLLIAFSPKNLKQSKEK